MKQRRKSPNDLLDEAFLAACREVVDKAIAAGPGSDEFKMCFKRLKKLLMCHAELRPISLKEARAIIEKKG